MTLAPTWQGVTIQILSGRLQFFLRSIQPAFWPAAPLRRTSVLPQAKPWRRANSLRPSISITEGWSDQRERNPKENATCRYKSHFLLVEAGRVELPSENASPGTSPGADGYLGSLALPVPFPAGKPSRLTGQVSFIIHGAVQSFAAHTCTTKRRLIPGSWSFPGQTAAFN